MPTRNNLKTLTILTSAYNLHVLTKAKKGCFKEKQPSFQFYETHDFIGDLKKTLNQIK